MNDSRSKRLSLMGVLLVAAVFILVGLTFYIRLAGRGANHNDSEPHDSLEELEQILNSGGLEHPNGYYTSTLTLAGTILESDVYHFAGSSIELSMRLSCEGGSGVSDYFTVELHRIELGILDVLVESRTLPRRGTAIVNWEDVPEGDYFFVFKKDADDQVVKSDDVVMQGYQD